MFDLINYSLFKIINITSKSLVYIFIPYKYHSILYISINNTTDYLKKTNEITINTIYTCLTFIYISYNLTTIFIYYYKNSNKNEYYEDFVFIN